MGLLDDAIREHLELKRLRGADPGEVARDEREALGPVLGDEDAALAAEHEGAGPAQPGPEDDGAPFLDEDERGAGAYSAAGEETAEIDMHAVLGSEARPLGSGGAASRSDHDRDPSDRLGSSSRAVATDEDSLEWEMPAARAEDFDPAADHTEDAEPVDEDDVLEDTPDFLRDTPDQERLWFEQRPPRDFDFKE